MPKENDDLSIITPVFNDRPALLALLSELQRLSVPIARVVIVEDGSLEEATRPEDLHGYRFDIELVSLVRNVGHQRAIAIGLVHMVASGGAGRVVVMDSDGEDRPQDVAPLLRTLEEGRCDVVVAQRRKRQEGLRFRILYQLYRSIFGLLTGQQIRFGNFCALNRRAVARLVHMQELWMHLPACLIASRLARRHVATDRGKRFFGVSKMNYVSLVVHGLRSVAVFVESVLTRIILVCAVLAGSSIVLIVVAVAAKLLGLATPGWMTTAVGSLVGFLVQTATLALISVLLAINTRNTSGVFPLREATAFIERVDLIPAER
jgi:polyisoprenyl-phosphate glycosyltransferase